MRLLISNHIGNAVEALRANRLRTILTIVGVTIGVASITAVLSLAGGATQFLSKQVAATNDSVALIRSNSVLSTPDSILADFQSLHATSTLTEEDVDSLSLIAEAKIAPMAILRTSMKAKESSIDGKHASLIGSNANLMSLTGLEIHNGQFLADTNGTNGIVLGNQLSVDLFGTEQSVGNLLKVRDHTYTIIGVLKATNQPVNYFGINFDNSAIAQLDSVKQFTQDVAQVQQIIVASDDKTGLPETVEKADTIMKETHQGEEDYVILTGDDITSPSSKLFTSITLTVAIITGISLLVGGIGIMNIMLVNVAERQREVGIRKAIGATNGHIINQFLIESAIIGLLGGIVGYLLGILTAFILGLYLPFSMVITWQIAGLSIGIAIVTGIIFGIYPAIRAAGKDPIEALHQ